MIKYLYLTHSKYNYGQSIPECNNNVEVLLITKTSSAVALPSGGFVS